MLSILNRIKRLPVQTEESLNDAMGLIVQLEEPGSILEWCRWVRKEAMALRTAEAYESCGRPIFWPDDTILTITW